MLSNTLPCNFLFVFCFGWQSFLLFISTGQVAGGLICNCIFISSVLVFLEFLFLFCPINFECEAYLPVNQILVYDHSKMLFLFFSQSWAWFKSIFLDSCTGFIWSRFIYSFCFLLLDLVSCKTGTLPSTFPSLQILFFYFLLTMNASPYQSDVISVQTFADIAFSS